MSKKLMFFVAAIICGIVVGVLIRPVHGRDLGQWGNVDKEIHEWYGSLTRPDPGYTTYSCCGDADAYWCDDVHTKDGHVFCAITDDRDDIPLKRPHRPIGEVHEIPPEKMKFSETDPQRSKASNPTGHAIIFLSSGLGDNAYVYCFVPGTGY